MLSLHLLSEQIVAESSATDFTVSVNAVPAATGSVAAEAAVAGGRAADRLVHAAIPSRWLHCDSIGFGHANCAECPPLPQQWHTIASSSTLVLPFDSALKTGQHMRLTTNECASSIVIPSRTETMCLGRS